MANVQSKVDISTNNCAGLTPMVITMDKAAVGDVSFTFTNPFKGVPVVASVSYLVPGITGSAVVAGMAGSFLKTVSATAITCSVFGGGTLTSGQVIVLLFGELA